MGLCKSKAREATDTKEVVAVANAAAPTEAKDKTNKQKSADDKANKPLAAKDVKIELDTADTKTSKMFKAEEKKSAASSDESDFDAAILSQVEDAVNSVMERKPATANAPAPTSSSSPNVAPPLKALNLAMTFGEGVSVSPTASEERAEEAAIRERRNTATTNSWSDSIVLYSTSCASTAELRNNISRMKQLLDMKRVPYEEVFLDIEPHRREDMLAITNGERKLPQLVNVARNLRVAGNAETMQEAEDFGELDDMLR